MNNEAEITMINNESPSAELIAAAKREATVTDSLGRVIRLKKPAVLAQFRLVEALGETSKNQVYMGMVMPLIFVAQIDGEAVPAPTSKLQVEALIQRLSDEGVRAVMEAVNENFGTPNPDADQAALKN